MRESLLSLADRMGGNNPVAAKAARLAMERAVHTACAPGASKGVRADILKELLAIVASQRPRMVRAHAIKLVGLIGRKSEDKPLARLANDPELKGDVQMARERLRRSG